MYAYINARSIQRYFLYSRNTIDVLRYILPANTYARTCGAARYHYVVIRGVCICVYITGRMCAIVEINKKSNYNYYLQIHTDFIIFNLYNIILMCLDSCVPRVGLRVITPYPLKFFDSGFFLREEVFKGYKMKTPQKFFSDCAAERRHPPPPLYYVVIRMKKKK